MAPFVAFGFSFPFSFPVFSFAFLESATRDIKLPSCEESESSSEKSMLSSRLTLFRGLSVSAAARFRLTRLFPGSAGFGEFHYQEKDAIEINLMMMHESHHAR